MNKTNEELCSVNVSVRIRPLLQNETKNVVQTIENELQVI